MIQELYKKANLPKKLSELILLAVKDCKRAQKNNHYVLDMKALHDGSDPKKCHVCMAGAVLAFTVKIPRTTLNLQLIQNLKIQRPIDAIDSVRLGSIFYALQSLGVMSDDLDDETRILVLEWEYRIRSVTRRRHRASFDLYEKLAKELGAAGL